MAQIKKTTGFNATLGRLHEAEQPYEGLIIRLPEKLDSLHQVVVAMNSRWIGDAIGYFYVDQSTDKRKFLYRDAWRAIWFDGPDGPVVYSALLSPFCTELAILIPNDTSRRIVGRQILVISGSGRAAMTLRGEIIPADVKRLIDDPQAREKFFFDHPSDVREGQVANISPGTHSGNLFLQQVLSRYPGISEEYRGSLDTLDASQLTNGASTTDRVISDSHVTISAAMLVHPIGLAWPLLRMVWLVSKAANDTTLRGSYFEGQFTGEEIGQTLGVCLENNARFRRSLAPEVLHDALEQHP